jgi:hypothetical protein
MPRIVVVWPEEEALGSVLRESCSAETLHDPVAASGVAWAAALTMLFLRMGGSSVE